MLRVLLGDGIGVRPVTNLLPKGGYVPASFFSRERDVAQAISICRACAATPPDRHGHAPDTDMVLPDRDYHAVAFKLAYDARMEAVKRVWQRDSVSIYWRDQASDALAAKLLKTGWLPGWYTRQSVDEMLAGE